jgi:hypothetical protein
VWQHPDLLPSTADLDEPAGFIDRVIGGDVSGIDIDAAIAEFQRDMDASANSAESPESPDSPEKDPRPRDADGPVDS